MKDKNVTKSDLKKDFKKYKTRLQETEEKDTEVDYFQDNIAWKLGRNPLQQEVATRHQRYALLVAFIIASISVCIFIHTLIIVQTARAIEQHQHLLAVIKLNTQ